MSSRGTFFRFGHDASQWDAKDLLTSDPKGEGHTKRKNPSFCWGSPTWARSSSREVQIRVPDVFCFC